MAEKNKRKTQPEGKTAVSVRVRKATGGRDTPRSGTGASGNVGTSSAKNARTARSAKGTGHADRAPREIDVPSFSRRRDTAVWMEALLWGVLAFCVILLISNFFGIGGVIGKTVSGFFFGVFGAPAYLLPFLLFFLAAFLIANRGAGAAWKKAAAVLVLYLCICGFCELLAGQYDAGRSFADYYDTGSAFRAGGGVAGGLLCRVLCPIFGQIASWIILLALCVICAVVITERAVFVQNLQSGKNAGRTGSRHTSARELRDLKAERNRLRKKQKVQREIEELKAGRDPAQEKPRVPRRQLTISGVSRDTALDPSLPEPEELHEVIPGVRQKSAAKKSSVQRERPQVEPSAEISPQEEAYLQDQAQAAGAEGSHGSRAKQLVDSARPKNPQQLDLHFTIQRGDASGEAEEDGLEAEPGRTVHGEPQVFIQRLPDEQEADRAESGVLPLDGMQGLEAEDEPGTPEFPDGASAESPQTGENGGTPSAHSAKPVKNQKSTREEQEKNMNEVAAQIAKEQEEEKPAYVFPPLSLLAKPAKGRSGSSDSEVKETAAKLQQTLHNFGVNVSITNVSCGPAVTRYELMPEQGVKVSRIVNLSDDIKLNLAAADIRIEAPIPGKAAVGIEVPNKENSAVHLRELLESQEFQNAKSNLTFAVGKDIAGKPVVADIAKMPHLLIAGATGSGKSVCINTLIMSILYKADPEDVKLIMIDPKVVELSVYNGIPHLFIPVVTDPKKASGALNWGVAEMTDRYQKFAECGVRDLKGYNARVAALADVEDENKPKKLPQIVIIVDELADLMMVAPGEVEDAICRLAQLARAAGIHLIIATQRPSVNVITGLIKANMPSRIAFSVTSGVDSRTIIDMNGAEKLLGKGDMLFYPQGYQKPVRVQGAFVSDQEVSSVTDFLTKKNDSGSFRREMEQRMSQVQQAGISASGAGGDGGERDSNFAEAGKFIIEKDKASIGMLQRVFKIGFNRAARIMDQLSEAGVVGPEEGTKPRKILMTMEEFERYLEESA